MSNEQIALEQEQSPLRRRLGGTHRKLSFQLKKTARAIDILDRNPDLEEMIEMFGLIRVPMRLARLYALLTRW